MATTAAYPVRVEASLDAPLSRGLWLVKWLLAIPHYFLLALLWPAFFVLTVVAFVAILITGRYPRAIFDFNVGVLRWSWRVHYYAYAALGTDRYPPFTLADVPDYPARLDIPYPQQLSRGLALVKWWLLAIPHYIIVGVFAGGGIWLFTDIDNDRFGWGENGFSWGAGGLIGVLVLIAGIVLLFTGRYPRPIFDFVLGMDRWVIRVAAYATLMTDEYPPFRLDMGGHDPAGEIEGGTVRPTPAAPQHGWTTGRVVSVVVGAVLALGAMGLITGGASLLWLDRAERDADGYVTVSETYSTGGYAIASDTIELRGTPADWEAASGFLGDVRVSAESVNGRPVFVGIAPSREVADYLAGTEYAVVQDAGSGEDLALRNGGPLPAPPTQQDFWTTQSAGPGTQSISWPAASGDWTVVVANADGSAGVNVRAQAGATVPSLLWIGIGVLVGGILLFALGAVLVGVAAAYRAAHSPPPTADVS
ncbi:hypothetical protein SacmaDRAFT_3191 [Saccharomonospora marina XMU15]|uniref:DUF4389 domain-containing protein n=1 Tax=Saccharomonospora marina XMU15 TaxID=882083 RepID=H5X8P8_9PSEU|nr:DUF4389 domain-containing protein [Saccharomonospora marina]EHR51417.1 hypothetical protein SacmaDRAFT_3191 [Saccharomonospora marina XMU15]